MTTYNVEVKYIYRGIVEADDELDALAAAAKLVNTSKSPPVAVEATILGRTS